MTLLYKLFGIPRNLDEFINGRDASDPRLNVLVVDSYFHDFPESPFFTLRRRVYLQDPESGKKLRYSSEDHYCDFREAFQVQNLENSVHLRYLAVEHELSERGLHLGKRVHVREKAGIFGTMRSRR
ncbi:hypothetical protein HZA98_02150 [Candidatus Woesearchaeota archaeon]|nr:hypothetical protein [Candidatus Woesearchaeota archaeon]